MKRPEIKARLEAAEKELNELLQEKMLLDMRLNQLTQTISALNSLLAQKPAESSTLNMSDLLGETGITNAIRLLLTNSKVPLSPVQIRDGLMEHGFELGDYASPMAVVHNTLKRLEGQGELMTVKNSLGQTVAYATRWQGGVPDINDPANPLYRSGMRDFAKDHPESRDTSHPKRRPSLGERIARGPEKK